MEYQGFGWALQEKVYSLNRTELGIDCVGLVLAIPTALLLPALKAHGVFAPPRLLALPYLIQR